MLSLRHTNGSGAINRIARPTNLLPELVDRFLNDDMFAPLGQTSPFAPVPLAMGEDEDHFYVEVDVPGLTGEDIDVTLRNGDLLISGERKRQREGVVQDSRTYGAFSQRIRLPEWVKPDKVDATLSNGVLSLVFTKGDESKPRKISVKAT